jgi:tetratricopeptide (TPR) repeat protein
MAKQTGQAAFLYECCSNFLGGGMNAQEYFNRGMEAFNNEDFDKAIENFAEAYRLDPNLAKAKMNLSVAYFNRGVSRFGRDAKGAIEDVSKAIDLNPKDRDARNARGFMYTKMKNYDGIIEDFSVSIDIKPTADVYVSRKDGYYGLCKKYRAAGDKDNFFKYADLAINDLNSALQFRPDDDVTRKLLELAREMLGHLTREREARVKTYEGLETLRRMITQATAGAARETLERAYTRLDALNRALTKEAEREAEEAYKAAEREAEETYTPVEREAAKRELDELAVRIKG